MKKLIAYYRVSTKKQGKSKLGLEAQQSCVKQFAADNGYTIEDEFTEVESGRKSARPQLQAAIHAAKAMGHTLIVAKLDRLSRSVAFTATLMESRVEFICCDNPHANNFTIHILAACAQSEVEHSRQRTKAAIAARKRRGKASPLTKAARLRGTKNGQSLAVDVAAEKRNARRAEHYAGMLPAIQQLRDSGMTYSAIAEQLNQQKKIMVDGVGRKAVTPTGRPFTSTTIYRLLTPDWRKRWKHTSDDILHQI